MNQIKKISCNIFCQYFWKQMELNAAQWQRSKEQTVQHQQPADLNKTYKNLHQINVQMFMNPLSAPNPTEKLKLKTFQGPERLFSLLTPASVNRCLEPRHLVKRHKQRVRTLVSRHLHSEGTQKVTMVQICQWHWQVSESAVKWSNLGALWWE